MRRRAHRSGALYQSGREVFLGWLPVLSACQASRSNPVTDAGDRPKGADKRRNQSAGERVGRVLARFDPENEALGPSLRDPQRAEQPVEQGQAGSEIPAKMLGIAGVVDLMVCRAGEDTSQLAGECDPDVRVLQVEGAKDVGQHD